MINQSIASLVGTAEPIAALNKIRMEENNEELVDLRTECPLIQVKEGILPYARKTVADMLNQAQPHVPDSYSLYVFRALRTIDMQKAHWDRYFLELQEAHPEWPLSVLRRSTNKYFAPYDQPAPPGHCTGGAIDIALIDRSGQPVDMLPPLVNWSQGYTYATDISMNLRSYRMLLLNIMLAVGFSNCRYEHWHYSYGDAAWAVRTGRTSCCYGIIVPPHDLTAHKQG